MILVNYKLYKEAWGSKGVELARITKEIGEKYKIRVVVTAPALEAVKIKEETGVEVWLQHVDDVKDGRGTGYVSAWEAMNLGIKGSLLNHSENKLPRGTILSTLRHKPEGFEVAVCAHSLGQIEWIKKASPEWILYEPPQLIASKDKSVATEMAQTIKKASEIAAPVALMVGAGVKSQEDVQISVKMGAKAVGLASGYVLSQEPREALEAMAAGFI